MVVVVVLWYGLCFVMAICLCRRCGGALCLMGWRLRIVCLFLYVFVSNGCVVFDGNDTIDTLSEWGSWDVSGMF